MEALAAPQDAQPIIQSEAQQSRDHAVSSLVTAAMAKAGMLSLTPEESAALIADFPDSDFQAGAGGKENLIYIEHGALRSRLNQVLGMGQWCIIVRETWQEDFRVLDKYKTQKTAKRVYARVTMMIRGCYVGDAVGDMSYFPDNAAQNYGDAFEGAKTAAFRRCAKEFGIGLQAWRKDWCLAWWARKNGKPAQQTYTPQNTTTSPAKPVNRAAKTEYAPSIAELDPGDDYPRDETPIDDEAAGLELGPETSADKPTKAIKKIEPQGPEEIEFTTVKPAEGKVWQKLIAKDGRDFSVPPHDKAMRNALNESWNSAKKCRNYRIEWTEEIGGKWPNRTLTRVEAIFTA